MKQTEKYKFNLIEMSDTFNPDALNANAETAERELAALKAADAALSQTAAANKTALEQALAAQKSELSATDAANKTALEQALAAQKAELSATDAANKAAVDQALANTMSALQTAIGSGGKTCRIAWGSFVGTGKSVTVDFKPLVLFFMYQESIMYDHIAIRGCNYSTSTSAPLTHLTWGERSVSWEDIYSSQFPTTVNYYVVLGESD